MLNNLECPAIPQLANDCKSLMFEWRGRMPTIEFDIHLCEVSCKHKECIDGFRWRAEPSMPEEYGRYKSLSPKDRSIFIDQNPDFFRKGKIYNYLEDRDRINNTNKIHFNRLLEWLKLPVEVEADEDKGILSSPGVSAQAHEAVDKMVNSYSGRMKLN